DRSQLFSGGSAGRLPLEQARHQWPAFMARLERQLSREDGDFLFGEASVADFAVAHCLWFLKGTPVTAPLVDDYPQVQAWLGRVLGFGHGAPAEMSVEEALEVARGSQPAALPDESFSDPNGFLPGQAVAIAATDYGVDAVQGELLFAGSEELILRREDPRAGTVHVHFPRLGFRIEAR
uniref:glutathione S-transferase family protein n=4 Tax=Gammaproteobacteria TaxID=1236 RepID=UPI00106B8397